MKTDFLKALGLEQDAIDKIMAENGKDVETAKSKYADYDSLKSQLTEANTTIEGFKAMNIDGIKAAADEWKAKAEKAESDAAAKIADMEFNGLLDGAITNAKGKSTKALRGLLVDQMDALKASKNQSDDIKAALDKLKESNGYLFEDAQTPPPYAAGPGRDPINPPGGDEDAKMRAVMGLPPLKN